MSIHRNSKRHESGSSSSSTIPAGLFVLTAAAKSISLRIHSHEWSQEEGSSIDSNAEVIHDANDFEILSRFNEGGVKQRHELGELFKYYFNPRHEMDEELSNISCHDITVEDKIQNMNLMFNCTTTDFHGSLNALNSLMNKADETEPFVWNVCCPKTYFDPDFQMKFENEIIKVNNSVSLLEKILKSSIGWNLFVNKNEPQAITFRILEPREWSQRISKERFKSLEDSIKNFGRDAPKYWTEVTKSNDGGFFGLFRALRESPDVELAFRSAFNRFPLGR